MERQSRPEDAETSPGGPLEGDAASSSLPQRIGVYRVKDRLGRGGMGEVFLARDERLERWVAVKRIRPDSGLSPEQRERFRREARMAARLSHPAIVQIHDLVTEGAEGDAIVMEYVEGRTLAARIAEGRLETAEALRLAQEIATGLAAAHEAGLIHRDLKAANVVVTRDGHAKILDFGLARPTGKSEETPLTRRGMVVGTLQSMSPEQARGQGVDERSDLFSLGILLYEMLTGLPPFRGLDSAAVLWQVVHETPQSARSLLPDLPAAAASLLDRLLAKDREKRPGSAREVIADLERIAAGAGRPAPQAGSVSDLPTAQMPVLKEAALPPGKGTPPSSLVGPLGRSPRLLWTAAAAALIAVVTTTVLLKLPSRAPLRVAVSTIEVVPAEDESLALAGSGVLTAALSGLAGLEGVAAIDPREASLGGHSPVSMALATAAGEVLTSEIRREGQLARVTLRRLKGADGTVLWTKTFPVPVDRGNLRVLADAVATNVRDAYAGHDLRPDVPRIDVRDQDYAAFLAINQRIDKGTMSIEPELEKIEAVVRSSPRFLEAQTLAARLALNLFESRRDAAFLKRASELVAQAKELSPRDPRPLRQELEIDFAANRTPEAEEILGRLERLLSGDPDLLVLRARLADRQGRINEAADLQAAAVKQAPSWKNVYWLADFEARRGRVAEARKWFDKILRQDPGNLWAKEGLAQVELLYGDLARAGQLYSECIPAIPRRALNNLGMIRFLRGSFEEAADAYRRALATEPTSVSPLIGLADVDLELGRAREAGPLYLRALTRLEDNERTFKLSPLDGMFKALCLARLDRSREAVELAQTQLRRNPENPNLLRLSALVHSLAGERASALNDALDALDRGLQPRFFAGSAFRWLRESPELRARLAPVHLP